MKLLVKGGTLVDCGHRKVASILIENDVIRLIGEPEEIDSLPHDSEIDASGCFVLPGIIDTHVHFREPGMTHKATIASESRAAVAGGITTFFDMPNTNPTTTSQQALDNKIEIAQRDSLANFAFYIGATNDNLDELLSVDPRRTPGVKLFMGTSTGGMIVSSQEALVRLFENVKLPIVAHCEDTELIARNMEQAKIQLHTDDPSVEFHSQIRSAEACYNSSRQAAELAEKYGARLHVAHVSTARELEMIRSCRNVTAEAVIAHLLFTDKDYSELGSLIKCNPAVKTESDRQALLEGLSRGYITTVGTDHAPHLLSEKQGGAARAVSGMPMIQFSLLAMLSLVDDGVISIEQLVRLMCNAPAELFSVSRRGYLKSNYKADIAIVRRTEPWTLRREDVKSLCGWSPLEGREFNWRVEATIVNGHTAYLDGQICDTWRGEAVSFDR